MAAGIEAEVNMPNLSAKNAFAIAKIMVNITVMIITLKLNSRACKISFQVKILGLF